jgi:arylsulfatase
MTRWGYLTRRSARDALERLDGNVGEYVISSSTILGLLVALLGTATAAQQPTGPLDRTVLPVPEPVRPLSSELDARNVKLPPRFEVRTPEGAANVVLVLIDDMGFGAPSTFGGPISMPTLDSLAQGGLRYNKLPHHGAVTLVVYIGGDNGTSGEGGASGMFNEMTYFNGVTEKLEDMLQKLDQWGGRETYPHMASGWAVALDSPFGWMKQVPRTSAARATEWSCTGRRASRRRTGSVPSSAT